MHPIWSRYFLFLPHLVDIILQRANQLQVVAGDVVIVGFDPLKPPKLQLCWVPFLWISSLIPRRRYNACRDEQDVSISESQSISDCRQNNSDPLCLCRGPKLCAFKRVLRASLQLVPRNGINRLLNTFELSGSLLRIRFVYPWEIFKILPFSCSPA